MEIIYKNLGYKTDYYYFMFGGFSSKYIALF